MNELDHELFEAELRELKPARPPAELMDRLVAAQPGANLRRPAPTETWRCLLRWLAPAAALAVVAALLVWWLPTELRPHRTRSSRAAGDRPAGADGTDRDRKQLAILDTMAQRSSAEPSYRLFSIEYHLSAVNTLGAATFRDMAGVQYESRDSSPERFLPSVKYTREL
ncbi:MAG: hypothetical protein HZA90_16940 [Verrucomicrobia bacterium]|nr:hypothetical protein [Verrucomicrobiota bacterium]